MSTHAAPFGDEVVREADDEVVLQHDGPARADQQQHDAVPAQQAGERHDERRDAELRDEDAVQRADRHARAERRERARPASRRSSRPGRSSSAVRTPATPDTKPTDRSISPSSRTKTMPIAMIANAAPCTMRLTMLPAVRKRSFWTWKTTQMTSSPRMIGRLPSSPPRTFSTQRLAYAPSVAVGRGGRRRQRRGDGAHAVTSASWPGTTDSLPAVIASTTSRWVVSAV